MLRKHGLNSLHANDFCFRGTISKIFCPKTSATFPLDLTKTRLQMQGEAALARLGDSARESAPYRGMVRTALGIVQEEGFLKLWQGVTPAIYRHVVYSGGRMVTYEHLREVVFGKSEDKHYPLWKSVIGGMMAGVVGQFLANPTDLVKVQMQMEGKRKLEGKPLRFRGVHHAFAKILSEGGIRGLWAGWVPNIQRAALVNMGDLTTYDTVKHYLVLNTPLEDNITTHGLSSLCSGLVASILGTPADVIKSRIMNQPRDKQGRGLLYKSSTDCLIQAVQGEGFMSLYKGFLPSWLRMVTSGFSSVFVFFVLKLLLICKYFPLSLLVFSMALPPNHNSFSFLYLFLFSFYLSSESCYLSW
ncbi:mitochondrial uncoupling protein 4 isoform X3 [Felis catus]|uniref:mitochondrial uncoupling protein 4 isoform X3 n=1 Tax=Felis catus TaxID=9685 RepID=UPI0009486DBF|nr:mitochondrial uncoupling protein 4 isoform X3 [Felis catus]